MKWRSLIHDRKTHALRLLKQLIVGRLELIPNMEERYYGFWGTGTPLPVIAGVVPQSVASPRASGDTQNRQLMDTSKPAIN
ncbi:MAG: hypothetical protein ACRD3C_24660 [Vicinamibacterales bacterium]